MFHKVIENTLACVFILAVEGMALDGPFTVVPDFDLSMVLRLVEVFAEVVVFVFVEPHPVVRPVFRFGLLFQSFPLKT